MSFDFSQVVFAVARMSASGVALLGTAFAVDKDKVATTAHVTGPSDEGLCIILPRTKRLDDFQDTTSSYVETTPVKIHGFDPIRDVCILRFQDAETWFGYALSGLEQASVGQNVAMLGYPHADHGRLVLTQQTTTIGAKILLGRDGVKTRQAVLNVQARPGQSGSPILSADGRQILAMLVGSYAPGGGGGISLGGVDPHTLHQTTHAISAEYIQEVLRNGC